MAKSPESQAAGRLAGGKSSSYVRAVNEVEARSSRHTAPYMLAGDVAYVLTATELGFTPRDSAIALIKALLDLLDVIDETDTTQPPGDVVAQREAWLRERAGPEHAAWLHLGRNRGESLRNYLPRLFFRHTLYAQRQAVVALLRVLLDKSAPALDALAPNYHHLHHSGFTTLGEYLLSWATTWLPHLERLEQVEKRLDKGPSFFGSRDQLHSLYDGVSRRLGFSNRATLRRDGIWVQDQFIEPFFVLSIAIATTNTRRFSRMAQDMRIWMTSEFALFTPADEHSGGSSALPHAKVPFGFQAVIGGAVMAATRLAGELAASSGPSEESEAIYHSASLYGTATDIEAWTRYMADVFQYGQFNLDEMERKATMDYAGSSEAHDRLVYDFGVPFRTGHRVLGAMVRAHCLGEPLMDLKMVLREETGRDIDVDQQEIMDIILGNTIWPTTFDSERVKALWSELDETVKEAERAVAGPGPVEQAISSVLDEARAWLKQAENA